MVTPDTDLPAYEDLIDSLAGKLNGLSTVHQGIGVATQSLVALHRELDQTKQMIDSLAASTKATLEDVRRLKPAELASTLAARLDSFTLQTNETLVKSLDTLSRETAESLDALSVQHKTVADSLVTFQESAIASLDALHERHALLHTAVSDVHQRLGDLGKRHDALLPKLDYLRHRQDGLLERLDALPPQLAAIQTHQTHHDRQIALLSDAVTAIRELADSTQAKMLDFQRASNESSTTLTNALMSSRDEILAELARTRQIQLVSLVVTLIAFLIVWAALIGVIPGM